MKEFAIVMNFNMDIFKPVETSYIVMLSGYGSYKFIKVYRQKFAVRPRGLCAGETSTAATSCRFQIPPLGACALTTRE
jgi:hypothetical protein